MKAFPYSVMTYNPNHPDSPRYTTTWHEGMDLRDYFAAQAMTGAQIWDAVLNGKNTVFAGDGPKKLAEVAYAIADAMLKAREK
jgi:hypothetical protein